jgi:hypothetical protein
MVSLLRPWHPEMAGWQDGTIFANLTPKNTEVTIPLVPHKAVAEVSTI